MKPFLCHIGPERHEALRHVAAQAGVSMAELLRRIIDHGLRTDLLNETFPHFSGRLHPRPETK